MRPDAATDAVTDALIDPVINPVIDTAIDTAIVAADAPNAGPTGTPSSTIRSVVLEAPPLAPAEAAAYFAEALRRSTDASDVYADLQAGVTDIIVVDARSPELYAEKHIPGAINVPHRTMGPETRAVLPLDKVIVTYCNGIGCNGSTKAAMKLARLGYQVKELIGGIVFWEYEGLPVVTSTHACDVHGQGVDCGC